jgi:RNA polymerase sigma-70 factor, ECF subfamily
VHIGLRHVAGPVQRRGANQLERGAFTFAPEHDDGPDEEPRTNAELDQSQLVEQAATRGATPGHQQERDCRKQLHEARSDHDEGDDQPAAAGVAAALVGADGSQDSRHSLWPRKRAANSSPASCQRGLLAPSGARFAPRDVCGDSLAFAHRQLAVKLRRDRLARRFTLHRHLVGSDQPKVPALAAIVGQTSVGSGRPHTLQRVDEDLATAIGEAHADVWRLCAYLVDRQSADDLAQETFLRAYRGMDSYRGEAPVRSWLLTIARRTCAAEIDLRARRRDLALKVRPIGRTETSPASGVDIELLIAALTPDRRDAFVLTQVIGCDYAEAAAICECPVGTIRSRVARARDDLIAAMSADNDLADTRPGS